MKLDLGESKVNIPNDDLAVSTLDSQTNKVKQSFISSYHTIKAKRLGAIRIAQETLDSTVNTINKEYSKNLKKLDIDLHVGLVGGKDGISREDYDRQKKALDEGQKQLLNEAVTVFKAKRDKADDEYNSEKKTAASNLLEAITEPVEHLIEMV